MKVRFDRVPGVDCDATATAAVEGYTPGHRSLDVVVYACEKHRQTAYDEWTGDLWAYFVHYKDGAPPADFPPHQCGDRTDFRDLDTSPSADEAPETQDVGELGLLDPMPYRLTINGEMRTRGTLQQIQAVVAELVTTRLAADPAGLAPDAQMLNEAFTSGAVQRDLDGGGIWYTIVGVHTADPIRIRITEESSEEA